MSTAALANNITSATTPIPATQAASATSGTLAGNFQTFLTLLTTQLQNQNPLDPLDTNQFTQQLVQFAGVEQQLKSNEQLSTLVSLQQTMQGTQALSFVGKTASVDGSTAMLESGGAAAWNVGVPTDANVTVTITAANGQTAFTKTYGVAAGTNQTFNWSGLGNDGTQWPPGSYTMTVAAKDPAGNPVAVNTEIQGKVTSVDLTRTPPLLFINGQGYTVGQIKSIVAETTTTPTTTTPSPTMPD